MWALIKSPYTRLSDSSALRPAGGDAPLSWPSVLMRWAATGKYSFNFSLKWNKLANKQVYTRDPWCVLGLWLTEGREVNTSSNFRILITPSPYQVLDESWEPVSECVRDPQVSYLEYCQKIPFKKFNGQMECLNCSAYNSYGLKSVWTLDLASRLWAQVQ